MGVPLISNWSGFKTEYLKTWFLFNKHGTKLNDRLGRSFYEAFSGNGSRDDIFKALSGTVKALEHSRQSCHINKVTETKLPERGRLFYYYEPVVLVKGNIFEMFLDDSNKLQIERVNRSQISFKYLSPNYKTERSSIVHIVSLEELPNFLNEKQLCLNELFLEFKKLEGLL